eukprot:7391931-Prymnesium_polylepis.2
MSQYTTKIRKERAALEPGDISLIMDYSEKLNKLRRTQVQSEHWGNVAMTLEVAVAEGFRPEMDDVALSALMAAVNASPIETRGDLLAQGDLLEKQVYYHCSDFKPQEARVTTHNMEVMLRELLTAGILKSGKTVYLKTDGCAKQYKCAKAMYLMCKLADSLGVVIDQMLEVTGHGKDEADGHGGVFKQWLTNEMQRADVELSDADLMEVADQVDGQEASFAGAMTKRAREGFAELKPASMNSKRRERSNTSKRVFKTYTEADIRDAPAMHAMTDQLARDMPADADARVKATLGHNNFRADPELQRDGKCVIAVRRLACACNGCRTALKRPITTRYSPHDNCVRAESFERRNDWKLVELKPANGDSAELVEEDGELALQDRTDAMACTTKAGDNLAMVGHDLTHAPDGYYLLRALGDAYELDADTTTPELLGDDGKPLVLPKGSWVVDAWYYNKAGGTRDWYYPFPQGDARGRVRVPSHMILATGFDLPVAVAPAPPKKRSSKWTANDMKRQYVAQGAVVLPEAVECAVRDELDRREE